MQAHMYCTASACMTQRVHHLCVYRLRQNARVALHGTQMLRTLRYGAAQRIQLRIFRHHLARRRTRDKVAAR